MTMTDTEAKAMAMVNAHAINRRSDLDDAKHTELRCALLDAVQSQAATEASHAAEMRELKERFSEAVCEWRDADTPVKAAKAATRLHDFILPAPDPVSEWLAECSDGRVSDHTMTMLRLFHNWLSEKETRKIGEAGE